MKRNRLFFEGFRLAFFGGGLWTWESEHVGRYRVLHTSQVRGSEFFCY